MNALPVLVVALCCIAIAYRYYSAFLAARALALDGAAAVPSGDGDYPAEASRAVQAVKQILPHVTIEGVEDVGYLDGTGRMSVLNYEVGFYEDGVEKEWNATPDGIVIQVPRSVDAGALPAAVREAATPEAGAKIRASVKQETRAGLRFVALPQAKVIYAIEFEHEGKLVKSKWNPDGSRVAEIDPAALLGGKPGTASVEAGEKQEGTKP